MTVPNEIPRVSYIGNATTTEFSYPYDFFAATDLLVQLFDTQTNQWVSPAPVLNGNGTYDYTVTGTVNSDGEYTGATVTFNNAPPANYKIVIAAEIPAEQPLELIDNSKYPAAALNAAFDRLALLVQQLLLTAGIYALQAPLSDEPASVSMTLPPAADRAGGYLTFDGNGNATITGALRDESGGGGDGDYLPAGQWLTPKTVTGASYQYSSSDYGCLVMRSNGGGAMYDVMPQANAGGGLGAGSVIAIRNDDGEAYLSVSAAAIGAPTVTTAIEGQVPERSDGNSLAFLEPGKPVVYLYDTQPTVPVWRDALRSLWTLQNADIAGIQAATGFNPTSGPPSLSASGPTLDYPAPRLAALEAVTGPLAVDFETALYRIWGTSVAGSGTSWSWPGRASAANYPRDTVPFTNFTSGTQRLISGVGQVIERAATNILANPGMTGAAAGTVGSGGALPTGWSFVGTTDPNITISVGLANYPDGTYNTNRVRFTITRSGSSVNNSTVGIRFAAAPGVQVPALNFGGVNFTAIAQVVSSSGVFQTAGMYLKEYASNGTTVVGATLGDSLAAASYGSSKVRVWRGIPQNNYADCQLYIVLSNPLSNFSVTIDIMANQLEDSADILDYTSYTSGSRVAETISLTVPTTGGMASSDIFHQRALGGIWQRGNAAGAVTVAAANLGAGYAVLERSRAYPAGALDWTRSWQAAATLEPAGTPETNSGGWTECQSGSIVSIGSANGTITWWQTENADTGSSSWACDTCVTKSVSGIVRLELRKGDHWSGDTGGNATLERTALLAYVPGTSSSLTLPMYQDNWVGFSFYIEPGSPLTGFSNNADWLRFSDLVSGAGNTDPLRIELTPVAQPGGDGEHLAVQVASTNLTVQGVANPSTYYPFTSPTAVERGIWHDLVYRVHLDETRTGSGALDLYLDGTLVYSYRGPLGYNSDPPSIKHQIVRPNPSSLPHETLALQFANFDIRTNGSNLSARATGAFPDVA